jgi:uncharacterized repeat protein (TIGR03803 family)
MTPSGGAAGPGTVFNINADGTGFGLLHSFAGGVNDGQNPTGSLTMSGSILYGMTQGGGSAANDGTVFRMNADGTGFSLLHSFVGGAADGSGPLGTPALSGSTLYGMTSQGSAANLGTVFRMNADGTGFSLLHSFDPAAGDGWAPAGSLTLSGTTLYGTTSSGGAAGDGTVFKMNADGTGYGLLHSFAGGPDDGAGPVGTLTLVGSTLYGTTPTGGANALGVLFDINTDGTGYDVLYSFAGGPNDGANPGDVIVSGSALYGMTGTGGTSNLGTVFSFPISVPEPSTLALVVAGGGVAVLACRRRKPIPMSAG